MTSYLIHRRCLISDVVYMRIFTGKRNSQQKPDDKIEIDLHLDELDLTSSESKATYEEIKDFVLNKYDLKVSSCLHRRKMSVS